MKFWIMFVLSSFVIANLALKLRSEHKKWIMLTITFIVFCGYYFWKQI